MTKKTKLARVHNDFFGFTNGLRCDLMKESNLNIPYTDFTQGLASFMKKEGIDTIIKRRMRRGGGFL